MEDDSSICLKMFASEKAEDHVFAVKPLWGVGSELTNG
jgi:hypothetical protein